MFRQLRLMAVLCAAAVLTAIPGVGAASTSTVVVPANASAYGTSYAEKAAQWWEWALTLPVDGHPLFDGPCESGQSGHVWFLAGTLGGGTVERSCEVPTGTALFFPVVNNVYLAFESEPETEEEIRELARTTFTELGAEVDGVAVTGLEAYLFESPLFTVAEPVLLHDFGILENNIRAVTTGIYLLLRPLPPGEHTVTFRGVVGDGDLLDVTYYLTVVPGGQS